jgi:hypothetical protein
MSRINYQVAKLLLHHLISELRDMCARYKEIHDEHKRESNAYLNMRPTDDESYDKQAKQRDVMIQSQYVDWHAHAECVDCNSMITMIKMIIEEDDFLVARDRAE